MRVLIADDDRISLRLLEADLHKWGHEVLAVADGTATWEAMQEENAPGLAIVDWMMPGLDGVEICRRARARFPARPCTSSCSPRAGTPEDIVEGLDAGADDYVGKPFDAAQLKARVGVGVRVVHLQRELAARIVEPGGGARARG